MRVSKTIPMVTLTAISLMASGCYEESGSNMPPANPAPAQPGPLSSVGQQPASSALGKAKQSATNVADRAEQKSRETADMADEMMDPGGKSDRPAVPPSDDPGR